VSHAKVSTVMTTPVFTVPPDRMGGEGRGFWNLVLLPRERSRPRNAPSKTIVHRKVTNAFSRDFLSCSHTGNSAIRRACG